MKVLIVGCLHGYWEEVVHLVEDLNAKGENIELVLINGDTQTFRSEDELKYSCKYDSVYKPGAPHSKKLEQTKEEFYGSFHKFVSGELKAPCLFLIIGGNNEQEELFNSLPFGGYIAPNVFYMGKSSIVDYKGIRIAGLSGIYDPVYYSKKYDYISPNNPNPAVEKLYSSHFIRACDPFQLELFSSYESAKKVDILMTHDWGSGIVAQDPRFFANDRLAHKRHLFKEDIAHTFGLPFAPEIVKSLNPSVYTAAHHHVYYEKQINYGGRKVHFIALGRPDAREQWYSIKDIPVNPSSNVSNSLMYAPEWIDIIASPEAINARNDPSTVPPRTVNMLSEPLYEIPSFKSSIDYTLEFQTKFFH